MRTLSFILFCLPAVLLAQPIDLYWPTPNQAFLQGKDAASYIQPSSSGRIISGKFGATRSGGRQFHEGVDIKPVKRNRRREPTDPVYAVMPGKVVYVNRVGGNSNYGKYITLEHVESGLSFYSLYAHLSSIDASVKVGVSLPGGAPLGVMGRTASHNIPTIQAHLHFEMGLVLSSYFDSWYASQKFSQRNRHGIYNGYNLVGWDALDFYGQAMDGPSWNGVAQYIKHMPSAFVLRVYGSRIPSFVSRNPALVVGDIPDKANIAAWDVAFTWYGVPHLWRAREAWEVDGVNKEAFEILSFDAKELKGQGSAAKTLYLDKRGKPQLGSRLKRELQLLFGLSNLK